MTIERVEIPAETVSAVGNVSVPEGGEQVQNLLWKLAEKAGPGLTSSEKVTFFHLFVSFVDLFAKSTVDLGWKDMIRHTIHTGNATPI